jgi:hypothetical protein
MIQRRYYLAPNTALAVTADTAAIDGHRRVTTVGKLSSQAVAVSPSFIV